MPIELHVQPLERWPRALRTVRKNRPFKMAWDKTLRLLKKELAHLDATVVIVRLAIAEKDISVTTGWPSANCLLQHPGVAIAADTRHGALKWICDDCTHWRDNVHAIVLTLERLRLADLYGVTGKGEQYLGWRMLPGPITAGAMPAMTMESASRFVAGYAGLSPAAVLAKKETWEKAFRAASKALHPDATHHDASHDAGKWKMFQEAAELLNNFHARR